MKPIHPTTHNNVDLNDTFVATVDGYDIYRTVDGDLWAHDANDGYAQNSVKIPDTVGDFMKAYENLVS